MIALMYKKRVGGVAQNNTVSRLDPDLQFS